jgi:hypothetical protein
MSVEADIAENGRFEKGESGGGPVIRRTFETKRPAPVTRRGASRFDPVGQARARRP